MMPYSVLDANSQLSTPRGWRVEDYLEHDQIIVLVTHRVEIF